MAEKSNIQWTDATWNIARGCSKVDEDCKFCYMFRESFNGSRYNPRLVLKTKTVFDLPRKLKKPSKIFVSSLTDVFHPMCDSFRNQMWQIIEKYPQHTYQILTKRPERIIENTPEVFFSKNNVWFGTSVGGQNGVHRINELLKVNCKVRFISFEPLHSPIVLSLNDNELEKIHWAILGGESGNDSGLYRYRPCEHVWMDNIMNSLSPNTAIFIKQMGTHLAKLHNMSDRHGSILSEFPAHLQRREFPDVSKF
jgi:protein gp37